jgi:hypothetical protein
MPEVKRLVTKNEFNRLAGIPSRSGQRWSGAIRTEKTRNSGTDGMFSDICLARLVWLTTIGDFQSKGNFLSAPKPQTTTSHLGFARLIAFELVPSAALRASDTRAGASGTQKACRNRRKSGPPTGSHVKVNYRSGAIRSCESRKELCRMNSNSVRTAFTTMAVMLVAVCVFQTRTAQSSSATTSQAAPKLLLLEKNEGERRIWREPPPAWSAKVGEILTV